MSTKEEFLEYLIAAGLTLADPTVSHCPDCAYYHVDDLCPGITPSSLPLSEESHAYKQGADNQHCINWRLNPIPEILYSQNLVEIIQREYNSLGVVKEKDNRLIVFYVFLGAKLLPEPVNIIFEGGSSSGKSWLVNASKINFPKAIETTWKTDDKGKKYLETFWKDGFGYVPLNDMTTASLYRIGMQNPDYFNNKVIIMGELPQKPSDEQVRVQQIIRQLISEGEVTKTMVIGDRSVAIALRGHPAFISCDATFEIDDQLMNRTLLLNPDEGRDQTKAILKKQGELSERPWLEDTIMKTSIIISQIHPLLEYYPVVNLWGTDVAKLLFTISKDQQLRRTFKQIDRMIKIRALLFQKQRESGYRKGHFDRKYLLATREDVIATIKLLAQTIQQTLTRVMGTALEFLKDVKNKKNKEFWKIEGEEENEHWKTKTFTYSDFASFKKTHYKSVYPHLKSLAYSGLLILDSSKRPHTLRLNLEAKTPENFLGFLRENLMVFFPEKELPEDLIISSRTSSNYGQDNPFCHENREVLAEKGEG